MSAAPEPPERPGKASAPPRGWRPALVALDVDGTLIRYDFYSPPSPAVHAAVDRARAAGAHIVVSTGRTMIATLPVCDQLGLTHGFAVSSNGAVIVDLGRREPVEVETFDATSTVRYFVDHIPDAVLAVEEMGLGFRVTGDFPAGELTGRLTVVQHEHLLDGPITRLVVRWPNGDRDRLRAVAAASGLPAVDYAIGYTAWLDIMPGGVSKGSALEKVRLALGVPASATLAIGDGHNDVEMLAWARLGVAMGNSPADVQALADEVAGNVEDDAVAHVLGRYFPA